MIRIDLNVEWPETFNVETYVVFFDNVVNPKTLHDDIHETLLFNEKKPRIFNVDTCAVLLFNAVNHQYSMMILLKHCCLML